MFLHYEEPDGSPPQKINSEPLPKTMNLIDVSPRGEWRLSGNPVVAQPIGGGTPIRVCEVCGVGWGPAGKYFYVRFRDVGEQGGGETVVLALPEGNDLLELPPGGLNSAEDVRGLKVVAEIDMNGKAVLAPGPTRLSMPIRA